MTMQTMQRIYVIVAIALAVYGGIAIVGATVLAVTRDGNAVGMAFDFYTRIVGLISTVLGALGVTHLIVNGGSVPTATPAPSEPAPGA